MKIKDLTEATPFKKIGNHKGYLGRTLTPSEQNEFKAKTVQKPPKPSKEEKCHSCSTLAEI